MFHDVACQGDSFRESVFHYIDKKELHRLASEGHPSAEYYYALSLRDDEITKRDSLIASASSKKLALATAALAMKSYLSNPTLDNLEAKKLFQQAVDNGYDYYNLINQIALTEQQLGRRNKVDICEAVRTFIGERYERPFILVKITGKKWAKKLVNDGEIFTRSLKSYREIDKPGVGDIHEGVANTKNALPLWKEMEAEALSEMMEVGMYDEYMAHERILCVYALEYSKEDGFIRPDIRMRQFGDSAVVIWDGLEFCRRFRNELKRKYGDSVWFAHKRVNYNVNFSKSQTYTEFSKTEPFAWQNEYRFVIDIANGRIECSEWSKKSENEPNEKEPNKKKPKNISDALEGMTDFAKLMYRASGGKEELFEDVGSETVCIGDISDISTIYDIEDFINLSSSITEKAVPYRIDDSYSDSDSNHYKAYAYRPIINLKNMNNNYKGKDNGNDNDNDNDNESN